MNIVRKNIYLSLPNLACLVPWREQYPNPRVFDSREICASYASFQL